VVYNVLKTTLKFLASSANFSGSSLLSIKFSHESLPPKNFTFSVHTLPHLPYSFFPLQGLFLSFPAKSERLLVNYLHLASSPPYLVNVSVTKVLIDV